MNGKITERIYENFGNGAHQANLHELCLAFLVEQKNSWPELKQAYEALDNIRSRYVYCNGFSVRLIFNPGRAINTTAAVSPQDIRKRPCFLCPSNLPEKQKGILYRDEYLVLGNPRPAVPLHMTISHLDHLPQEIIAHTDTFLKITADLGANWTTLYNGPGCGASAPDHLHFQAIPSGQMPIEDELDDRKMPVPFDHNQAIRLYRGVGLGRDVLSLEGNDASMIANAFKEYMEKLKKVSASREEPMVNIVCKFNKDTWRLMIFPRRVHRPPVFFKEGDERIVVSPAVMEMAGIIVTPVERDFDRLDAAAIESIYREVSLSVY